MLHLATRLASEILLAYLLCYENKNMAKSDNPRSLCRASNGDNAAHVRFVYLIRYYFY